MAMTHYLRVEEEAKQLIIRISCSTSRNEELSRKRRGLLKESDSDGCSVPLRAHAHAHTRQLGSLEVVCAIWASGGVIYMGVIYI